MLYTAARHAVALDDIIMAGKNNGGTLNGWLVLSIASLMIVAGLTGFFAKSK